MNLAQIQADFDKLAQLDDGSWNHNNHYHSFLLRHLPTPCDQALDVGCGTGTFSRQLATRAQNVMGLDLSPEMIKVAQHRSANYPNLSYQVADLTTWPFPAEHFDCIASIATLHHVNLPEILPKLTQSLKKGGVLLILDLYDQAENMTDVLWSIMALPLSKGLRRWYTGQWQDPPAVQQAWAEHGQYDHYLSLSELKTVCTQFLPQAQITKHLLWRYSVVWHKP